MNKYKIYITKAENGLFVAFSNDYPISIEDKSEENVFKHASRILKEAIIRDLKEGKKIVKPKEISFEDINLIIDEYKIKGALIVREVSIPELLEHEEALKSERINITIPRYLKALAEYAGLSPSKVAQEALILKLGL